MSEVRFDRYWDTVVDTARNAYAVLTEEVGKEVGYRDLGNHQEQLDEILENVLVNGEASFILDNPEWIACSKNEAEAIKVACRSGTTTLKAFNQTAMFTAFWKDCMEVITAWAFYREAESSNVLVAANNGK